MSSDAKLTIRQRRGGKRAKWKRGCWRLDAERRWVVEGPPKRLRAVEEALPDTVIERVGGVLLLTFGNAVGRFDGGPLGPLRVRSGKWTDAEFNRMLEKITKRAAALPFTASAASALPYLRDAEGVEDVLYHAFVYLRHAVSTDASREAAILPALAGIVRRPHRQLRREGRVVPIELARRVDPPALIDLAAGRRPMRRARKQGPLSSCLRGHLPLEVEESIVCHTLDTPENRFVKAFLERCLLIVQRMRERSSDLQAEARARLQRDCDAVDRALAPARRASMWADVGVMTHFPAASPVLHGRSSYRTVFDTWRRLHLGSRLPLKPRQAQRFLEVKDIALLYELWCCFGLVDAVTAAKGEEKPCEVDRPERTDFQASVPYDWQARWTDGTTVTYNPRFSRSKRDQVRRSYSVPLRPDLALEVPTGKNRGLHLFDAKFRLDRLDDLAPAKDDRKAEAKIEEQERRSRFKRADLYKMHAYRDAIPRARSAWVLYPGTAARFFGKGGEVASGFGAGDFPDKLRGVGGVPMPGGKVGTELVSLVQALLGQTR